MALSRRHPLQDQRSGFLAAVGLVIIAFMGFCGGAFAQTASGSGVVGLDPPELVTKTAITYPKGAPEHDRPITVRVTLRVGPDGSVKKVDLVGAPQPPFDAPVIAATATFGFKPARYKGKAVTVEIAYAHSFLPPPKPVVVPKKAGLALDCELRGRLREKGTRTPVARVTVAVLVKGQRFTALSNAKGRFQLRLPHGKARVTIHGSGYLAFLQTERLEASQRLAVAYLVEREYYDPYEIVVHGTERRTEISRVTLKGKEMTQIPGTFGDPFRVIQTLPGVASAVSLLPFPIVRGASPGSTGFLIDRVRVPLLFHLLAGPSVIHPDFLDEVHFHPGGFPVPYGGYTAGIVDGRTRRAQKDEKLIDVNLNLLQSGALIRYPVGKTGMTATVAGRIGYPGVIMSLATDQASLSYWDYQLRLDGGTPKHGFSVFAFGASDEIKGPATGADPAIQPPELVPLVRFTFHRLDLRYRHRVGKIDGMYRAVIGVDDTLFGPTAGLQTISGGPLLKWRYRLDKKVEISAGLEGSARDTQPALGGDPADEEQAPTEIFTEDLSRFYVGSIWLEALLRPNDALLLRPGIRGDVRYDGNTTLAAADPRLSGRYNLGPVRMPLAGTMTTARDDEVLWLKAAVGLYHQPPRFFIPVPGIDQMPLKYGLLSAIQTTIGAEMPLAVGLSLDVQAFYNHMDPVIFDLEVNAPLSSVRQSAPDRLPGQTPTDSGDQDNDVQAAFEALLKPQNGRAYGLEVMIRRKSRTGVYGWLSYTLSLSERQKEGVWAAFDFDRTHLLNLVAAMPLPRNWEIGARFQYQHGKPTTTTAGYNTARTDGFMRLDIRIDKRAVWNNWLLDFYVDITNVALFPEEIGPGQHLRYVLPTVGFRARL
jgi:hypothetical protein